MFFNLVAITNSQLPTVSASEADISEWPLRKILSVKYDTSDLSDQLIDLIKPYFTKIVVPEKVRTLCYLLFLNVEKLE